MSSAFLSLLGRLQHSKSSKEFKELEVLGYTGWMGIQANKAFRPLSPSCDVTCMRYVKKKGLILSQLLRWIETNTQY